MSKESSIKIDADVGVTDNEDGVEDVDSVNVMGKCVGMFVKVLDVNAKRDI